MLIERGVLDPAEAVRMGVDVAVWRRNTLHKWIQAQGRRLREAGKARDTHSTASTVSRVMRAAGAVVILAHPAKGNRQPDAAERRRIHRWLDRYVDGVEVYHYHNAPDYRRMLLDICHERGCLVTGGSDRHVHVAGHGPDSEAPGICLTLLKDALRRRQTAHNR